MREGLKEAGRKKRKRMKEGRKGDREREAGWGSVVKGEKAIWHVFQRELSGREH